MPILRDSIILKLIESNGNDGLALKQCPYALHFCDIALHYILFNLSIPEIILTCQVIKSCFKIKCIVFFLA